MSEFNPFDKAIGELNAGDIYTLSQPEGVYIDYKRDLIKEEWIAKAVASFANTYGGLLFIGIEEDAETNEPSEYFTISSSNLDTSKETVRSAIKEYISPTPNYAAHLFKQNSGGAVIMIAVPEGRQPPYVSSNGKIYRRNGEGSDPYSPITDSQVVDQLYQEGKDWNEKVSAFCTRDVGLTKGQAGDEEIEFEGLPTMEMYGIPSNLHRDLVCRDVLFDIDGFIERVEGAEAVIFDEDSDMILGIQGDSYRSTSQGIVVQTYTINSDTGEQSLASTPKTFSFFADGSLKSFMPISLYQMKNQGEPWEIIQQNSTSDFQNIRLVKGTTILRGVISMYNLYIYLLSEYDWFEDGFRDLSIKIRFDNLYRTLIVFEQTWYSDLIQEYGLAIVYEEGAEIPRYGTQPIGGYMNNPGSLIYPLINQILEAMGIPVLDNKSISETVVESLYSD